MTGDALPERQLEFEIKTPRPDFGRGVFVGDLAPLKLFTQVKISFGVDLMEELILQIINEVNGFTG